MKYIETKGDLFTVGNEYALAHCCSACATLGAGIAPLFVKNFPGIKEYIKSQNPQVGETVMFVISYDYNNKSSPSIIFNLITKEKVYHKPTYLTLFDSLIDMRWQIQMCNIKKLAIPLIGSGLDKLDWLVVKDIVKSIFFDLDLEIKVYFFDPNTFNLMEVK